MKKTVLFLFLSCIAFAQKGSIKGFVVDKANGEGIPFGTVKVEGTEYGAATDDRGFFSRRMKRDTALQQRLSHQRGQQRAQGRILKRLRHAG